MAVVTSWGTRTFSSLGLAALACHARATTLPECVDPPPDPVHFVGFGDGRQPCPKPATPVEPELPTPRTLTEAWQRLDDVLPVELIEDMRSGRVEAWELYRSVGMWMRNTWGLWHADSEIYRWFRRRGIDHPEWMSVVVVESYIRRLQGSDEDPEASVATSLAETRMWAAEERIEPKLGSWRAERAAGELIGWKFEDRVVPIVALPEPGSIRVAKLEPTPAGIVVFVERVPDAARPSGSPWHDGVYLLESPHSSALRPLRVRGCEAIQDVITIDEDTYWLCRTNERFELIASGIDRRQWIPTGLPVAGATPRLGTNRSSLIVTDRSEIWQWDRGEQDPWRVLVAGQPDRIGFEDEVWVPRMVGDRLLSGYPDWGLLMDLVEPFRFQRIEWLLVSRYGPEFVHIYSAAPSKLGVWLCVGHRFRSTLLHITPNATSVAVFAGRVAGPLEHHGGVPIPATLDAAELTQQISATAVLEHANGLFLAGDLGISVQRDGVVRPIVRFSVEPELDPELEPESVSSPICMTRSCPLVVADRVDPSAGDAFRSDGPTSLAIFDGKRPSFVLGSSHGLVVVRAEGRAGYSVSSPSIGEPIEVDIGPGP